MLRQKTFFLLLVISLMGLFVLPPSNGDAVTQTPDSTSSEHDPASSEALTEQQRDALDYANRGFNFLKKKAIRKGNFQL